MASVVFLRGVNVGTHKRFQPALVARALAHLEVVNVGAAGTFLVRKTVSAGELRSEILRHLPFEADIMICTARELLRVAAAAPFPARGLPPQVRRFASVLAHRPRGTLPLPFHQPAGAAWQVKILAVTGQFVVGLWRRRGSTFPDPNMVTEKHLGVTATTRNWNTIEKIRDLLLDGRR